MRLVAVVLLYAIVLVSPARSEPLVVFAAASLKGPLDAIADVFTDQTQQAVVISYAASSALARQIEQGAPADLFASASDIWTDYLAGKGLLEPETVDVFASNRLVLLGPLSRASDVPPDLASVDEVLSLLGPRGRMAVAMVDAVPAGLYAREALESLGTWEALNTRLAQTDNVRAALILVARGEAPLGIVYLSDAMADDRVVPIATFPETAHSPVRYTSGVIADTQNREAEQFVAFLKGEEAQQILAAHGFLRVQ